MICNFLNTRFYSITVLCGFNTISDFCDILKESIHEIYFLITWRIFITNDSLLTANDSVSASESARGRYEPVLVLWLKEKRVRRIFLYFSSLTIRNLLSSDHARIIDDTCTIICTIAVPHVFPLDFSKCCQLTSLSTAGEWKEALWKLVSLRASQNGPFVFVFSFWNYYLKYRAM